MLCGLISNVDFKIEDFWITLVYRQFMSSIITSFSFYVIYRR